MFLCWWFYSTLHIKILDPLYQIEDLKYYFQLIYEWLYSIHSLLLLWLYLRSPNKTWPSFLHSKIALEPPPPQKKFYLCFCCSCRRKKFYLSALPSSLHVPIIKLFSAAIILAIFWSIWGFFSFLKNFGGNLRSLKKWRDANFWRI